MICFLLIVSSCAYKLTYARMKIAITKKRSYSAARLCHTDPPNHKLATSDKAILTGNTS